MDAQVANLLLVANRTDLGSSPKETLDLYEKDRLTADASLQRAAAIGRDDPVAQRQIRLVLDGLGAYEALAAQAILLEQSGTSQPGRPPSDALGAFRNAGHLADLPTRRQAHSGAQRQRQSDGSHPLRHQSRAGRLPWRVRCI
jgi:hypothetical protein